jgi:hypothetical protein
MIVTATALVRYDAMCRAIAEAHAVDEVKDIRDKALAWEMYSRQAKNYDAERDAIDIRIRAERKAGQLLKAMEKAKGGRPSDKTGNTTLPVSLQELGVSKRQSADWQKLADVPDEEFDAALADKTARPTTNGIIRATTPPKVTPVSEEALWLWARLCDFGSDEWLAKSPADVMSTMTAEMKDDVHRLAPCVAAWFKQIGKMP